MAVEHLKPRVYRRTKTFLFLGGFVLVWVNLGMPHAVRLPWEVAFPTWVKAGALALATAFVAALDSLPGDRLKASLVFWRRKNPLPGTRAFEKATLSSDPRISVDRLKARLGGTFPRSPQDQNSTWYRLYKELEEVPQVSGAHYEYLLFRDLTWFSAALLTLGLISIIVNSHTWKGTLVFVGGMALSYLTFRRAACERGVRFVSSVLAVASAREPNQQ